MARLLSDMDYVAGQPGLREVVVPVTTLEPTTTTDQLTALGLDGLGSQFTTYYDQSNKPRAQNIMQAAKLVDGTVIKAGAVFSLNDTLGPRTVNRGFDYAPVIQDGVLRLGVGVGCASSPRRSSTPPSSQVCRSSSGTRTTSTSTTTPSAATLRSPMVRRTCGLPTTPPHPAAALLGGRRAGHGGPGGQHRTHGHLHDQPVLRHEALGHVAQPSAGHHRTTPWRAASSPGNKASTAARSG